MALVTVQRSPSPSTEHDTDSLSEDTTDGKSHLKKRLKTSKQKLRKVLSSVRFLSKLRPGLSESYFAYKGAALILHHTECPRKPSKKSHGGEIQDHLQAMLLLLRPEDQIKLAVRLEDVPDSPYKRYICVVATRGRQDTEEAVILGMDCRHGEALIGLVLPVWLGVKIQLEGDGSFRMCTDGQAYLFNPVSVQAMWSAIQSLVKVLHNAEEMKYIHDGLTHTWVGYYRSRIDHSHVGNNHHWNIEGVDVFAPSILNIGDETVKKNISKVLKEVLLSVDLDEVSCRVLRNTVEDKLGFSVQKHKAFFDEEIIRIMGQMDSPAKILDYLYLGSEWNASNFDELTRIGIGYILNVTKEIDNFFAGTFQYYTVRVVDVPESDLLKHWDKTFKFISKAKSHGSKVFVHCKMGISRSASTVMAYLMKENRWSVDEAFKFVRERRAVANPNEGFMEQLHMYEGILSASNKRDYFRSKALDNQASHGDGCPRGEGLMEHDYDCMLGDSLMNVMATDEWMNVRPAASLEEDLEQLQYGPRLFPLGPDLEGTESRSGDSMEESLSELPSLSPPSHSCEKTKTVVGCELDSKSGDVEHHDNTLEGSPGLFKVKPDSFWIKQEDEDSDLISSEKTPSLEGGYVEMSEESTNVQSCQCPTTAVTGDQHNLKSSAPICNLQNKLNPSSLSNNDSNQIFKDQTNSFCSSVSPSANPQQNTSTTTTTAPFPKTSGTYSFIPITSTQLSDAHSVPSKITSNPLSMDQIEISMKDATTTDALSTATITTVVRPTPLHSSNSQQNNMIKKSEGLSVQQSGFNPISKNNNDSSNFSKQFPSSSSSTIDLSHSMQAKQKEAGETSSSSTTSIPSHPGGKLESGIRDYFFREKIPWSPGKVQKMREGIDRVGFGGEIDEEGMEGVLVDSGGGGAAAAAVGLVPGLGNVGVEDDEARFKMDIDKERIILDERMEVSSPMAEWDSTKPEDKEVPVNPEVGGDLSLYQKEEIPMEPGTVLRTRMEIEERQKFTNSCGGDGDLSSPTKPVLRTSSLKMTNETSGDQSIASNMTSRRVSCGPIMEPIGQLRKFDIDEDDRMGDDDNDLMMEEEVLENNVELSISDRGDSLRNQESKNNPDFPIDSGPNFNSESSTDPEQAQDNSGIVKLFVRKIEKHPPTEETTMRVCDKTGNDASVENDTLNVCGDIQFKPPSDSLALSSSNPCGAKIDFGLVSGESNTDDSFLLIKSTQEHCEETTTESSSVVRHLVGQFETKTPLECSGKVSTDTDQVPKDVHQEVDSEMIRHVKQEPPLEYSKQAIDGIVLPVSSSNDSTTVVGAGISPQKSSTAEQQHHAASSIPPSFMSSSLSETITTTTTTTATAAVVSTSPQFKTLEDDTYSPKERHKEVWNPYQQTSEFAEFVVEDISTLRQKFERNSSFEEGEKGCKFQNTERTRKLPRPKSVERMCDVFEGQSKSDTSLDERKEEVVTTFRQVSEEGRKVRRLHGKSHPLTKLSQGRGMFHSSM